MISIVVPIYNVERYVAECFDSIVSQTFRDFEVVAVDDCSSDKSMTIAEQYASKLPMRIVHHEQNRGLSAARNTGLNVAQGEYVLFVDSDDVLSSDCLQTLHSEAILTNADVVVGNLDTIGEQKFSFVPHLHCTEPLVLTNNTDVLRNYMWGDCYIMAWNKLLKRSFLLQNKIAFDEGLLHEDNTWSLRVAEHAQSMTLLPNVTYHYRLRQGSLQTDADFQRHFEAYCCIITLLGAEIESNINKFEKLEWRGWFERQKALFFKQTEAHGTAEQLSALYQVIRETLPQYRIDKFFAHYWLPKSIGQKVFSRLCGVWLI